VHGSARRGFKFMFGWGAAGETAINWPPAAFPGGAGCRDRRGTSSCLDVRGVTACARAIAAAMRSEAQEGKRERRCQHRGLRAILHPGSELAAAVSSYI
jgi:hypothetical protein